MAWYTIASILQDRLRIMGHRSRRDIVGDGNPAGVQGAYIGLLALAQHADEGVLGQSSVTPALRSLLAQSSLEPAVVVAVERAAVVLREAVAGCWDGKSPRLPTGGLPSDKIEIIFDCREFRVPVQSPIGFLREI